MAHLRDMAAAVRDARVLAMGQQRKVMARVVQAACQQDQTKQVVRVHLE